MRGAIELLPDAIEALAGLFRVLRSRREAESVISHLRTLTDSYRSDIDDVKRDFIERARHSDGTAGSD